MKSRFLEALARGPILLDAAMGTRLMARGLDLASDDPCLWCSEHPDDVLDVHRRDVAAGSEAIFTNTFGANFAWLERFGAGDETWLINQRGVRLARSALGPSGFVIGSIGPTAADHQASLLQQANLLVEEGVDALILETHQLDQACSSLRLLRNLPTPIIASLFDWPEPIADAAHRLIDLGASVIGANCLSGMASALNVALRLAAVTDHPLLIKPSAGLPGSPLETPQNFADAVPELLAYGVKLIGGCCGTTEAHVAAIRSRLARPERVL